MPGLCRLRKKREEARLVREKVGAHYRKYRKETGENLDENKWGDKEIDTAKAWLEDVNEDPYIGEAVNIIEDIRNL